MIFRVGMKVVCVDDRPAYDGSTSDLVKGEIYTIASIEDGHNGPAVTVCEVPMPDKYWYGFRPSRFRPVQERKRETSIEVFKKLLNPSKVDA